MHRPRLRDLAATAAVFGAMVAAALAIHAANAGTHPLIVVADREAAAVAAIAASEPTRQFPTLSFGPLAAALAPETAPAPTSQPRDAASLRYLADEALDHGPASAPGPTAQRISPARGGWICWQSHDLSFLLGTAYDHWPESYGENPRLWLWTQQTGTRWLDQVVKLPAGQRLEATYWTPTDYILVLRIDPPGIDQVGTEYLYYAPSQTWIVHLPKDPPAWFHAGDLDRDFDIDQADFGRLQACLSGRDQPPAAGCEAADLDHDRDVDADDVESFRRHMTGAR